MKKAQWYMKALLTAAAVVVATLVAVPVPVHAIADPDTPPAINATYVYENVLEDGDIGILADYYLDYAVPPTETATEAFLVAFIDTDGATQLGAVAPYTYNDDGYGRGVAWIYFTAAEVTAYGIDSANQALHSIWFMGNPTLSWVGDPPKTVVGIDYWATSADPSTLIALRVLYYADALELAWGVTLLQATSLGTKLADAGEAYFTNAILNLRLMAPSCFASGELDPESLGIDYTTTFGATMADGTGTVVGSPITLTEGNNTVTVTVAGTFTLELELGTYGTITNGTGTVNGSPVDLTPGTNTVTVPGGGTGTLIVAVARVDTSTVSEDTIVGTGFDLTTLATRFGMSRWLFSGLVWLVITILVCVPLYTRANRAGYAGMSSGNKVATLVFGLMLIGGAVIGFVHPMVPGLMAIGVGIFVVYVTFHRGANY